MVKEFLIREITLHTVDFGNFDAFAINELDNSVFSRYIFVHDDFTLFKICRSHDALTDFQTLLVVLRYEKL